MGNQQYRPDEEFGRFAEEEDSFQSLNIMQGKNGFWLRFLP